MKFNALAVVAAGLVVAGSAFAGDKACCAQHAKNDKAACAATFASLDLTAEQKTKMETLAAECDKAVARRRAWRRWRRVQGHFSKEQFAAWQSACKAKMTEKTELVPLRGKKSGDARGASPLFFK